MDDFTVGEAAEKLGYSDRWITDLLKKGRRLTGYKRGRRWFVPEAEIQRCLSGKTVGQEKVLNEGEGVENLASRGSLLTDLMSDQVNELMSRHSMELRSEAGRWRDLIRTFQNGMEGDLESLISVSSGTLTNTLFCAHLQKEFPSLHEQCCAWHRQAQNLKEKMLSLQREWAVDVIRRLKDGGKPVVDTSEPVDWNWQWHHSRFPQKLWDAIFNVSGLHSQEKGRESQYHQGNLYFAKKVIASGTEQWTREAKDLFKSLYQEQQILLSGKMQQLGLFEEAERIKKNNHDVSHKLDIICNGGVFKPGNCEVCALLLR